MGACEAHNLEVVRSKLTFATCEISDEISFLAWVLFFYFAIKMKLVVGFACARTLLTLSKPIQHFATAQQPVGHSVHSRLPTFSFKARTAMTTVRENSCNVGYALFDATGTLMHLKEPVGETYCRYAIMHGLQVGSPAALDHRFKTTYSNTVCFGAFSVRLFCVFFELSMDFIDVIVTVVTTITHA